MIHPRIVRCDPLMFYGMCLRTSLVRVLWYDMVLYHVWYGSSVESCDPMEAEPPIDINHW